MHAVFVLPPVLQAICCHLCCGFQTKRSEMLKIADIGFKRRLKLLHSLFCDLFNSVFGLYKTSALMNIASYAISMVSYGSLCMMLYQC
jgi:hypothetical protein